jgi:predicted trehalose synthase
MAIFILDRRFIPDAISFSRFRRRTARPLGERKLKRSALRDVAGMMRSFQYAAYSASGNRRCDLKTFHFSKDGPISGIVK